VANAGAAKEAISTVLLHFRAIQIQGTFYPVSIDRYTFTARPNA